MLGAVLAAIMTFLLFILNRIPNSKTDSLLVIKMNDINIKENIDKIVKDNSKRAKVVSTIVKNGEIELIYEIETNLSSKLTNELSLIKEIKTFSIVDNSGDRRL